MTTKEESERIPLLAEGPAVPTNPAYLRRAAHRIAPVFLTLIVVVIARPTLVRAQTYRSRQQPRSSNELARAGQAPSEQTVVIDQATLQQILARLESAENEIRTLRQPAPAAPPARLPAAPPAPKKAPEKKADPPKVLTPISGKCGNVTFKPGVRLQPRYIYDELPANHDFLIRRFRLKAGGDVFDLAKYGAELKIDSTGRFEASPSAIVENAWLDFPLAEELAYLRVGLYDAPFSYDALTSDSKLLFMDRTLIKESLTDLGITDNTVGLLLHGRPYGGSLEYAVGIFDNLAFEKVGATGTKESDELMPAGRVAWHILDPPKAPEGYADYQESYIGEGERLSIGANAASLGDITSGVDRFDLIAWGTDVFYNVGRFTAQAEYDWFIRDMIGGGPNEPGDGWYVQSGYLIWCYPAVELAARYQELDFDKTDAERLRWTSFGFNIYIREHNLKIQTDYTFKREDAVEIENDVVQTQLQFDY